MRRLIRLVADCNKGVFSTDDDLSSTDISAESFYEQLSSKFEGKISAVFNLSYGEGHAEIFENIKSEYGVR